MLAASCRISAKRAATGPQHGQLGAPGWAEAVAAEIVAHGDGPAFLKAVRRGRATQRQNHRYQILREVEKLAGDKSPRRRPEANTPDALALKNPPTLELESTVESPAAVPAPVLTAAAAQKKPLWRRLLGR